MVCPRNYEENRHINGPIKSQLIGGPFCKRAPIDTVFGLLERL